MMGSTSVPGCFPISKNRYHVRKHYRGQDDKNVKIFFNGNLPYYVLLLVAFLTFFSPSISAIANAPGPK